MTDEQQRSVDVLNGLYTDEMQSVLARLIDMDPFVSWATADELDIVQRICTATAEHRELLIDAIERCGGAAGPATLDYKTANLHYLSLSSLLPRIVEAVESLARAYAQAATETALAPEARRVIAHIAQRHQAHLEQLRRVQAHHAPGSV